MGVKIMSDKIKRLNRELVYQGTILDIYSDTMDVGNGKIEEWLFCFYTCSKR